MDAIESLSQLGQVRPADQAVLTAALERLEEAAGQGNPAGRPARWRSRRFCTAIGAVAAGTVVVLAVLHIGHPAVPTRRMAAKPAPLTTAGGHEHHVITSVLAAFSASADDVIAVTKTMRGDFGTLGATTIWVAPAQATPGSTVRSRIRLLTPGGARQMDLWLTYQAPASTGQASTGQAASNCAAIFTRPRIVPPAEHGVHGRVIAVYYQTHAWISGKVTVQAATLPSAATLDTCLKSGQWTVRGPAVVDGARTVELTSPSGQETLWVSAATFLPVRLVSSGPDVDTITFTFSFLPPTAANEAKLRPPPAPAGFRKIASSLTRRWHPAARA